MMRRNNEEGRRHRREKKQNSTIDIDFKHNLHTIAYSCDRYYNLDEYVARLLSNGVNTVRAAPSKIEKSHSGCRGAPVVEEEREVRPSTIN